MLKKFSYVIYYETNLDSSFRQIVWIAQLRRHKQAEIGAELDDAVSQLNVQRSALLKRLPQQQRLQHRVEILVDVLQQHRRAELDAVFQRASEARVGRLDDVQVVRLLHVLDPLVRLALRVDQQRPTTSVAGQKKHSADKPCQDTLDVG